MNKDLRESYRIITNIGGLGLCNFCRYASFSGSNCCDGELECEHPIEKLQDKADEVWSGEDCWGFRLQKGKSLQTVAEKASIYHDGNFPYRNKKGELVAIIPNADDKITYGL